MKKCIIIGSGLGGLSTGVILAKNGYDVTILEQAGQIGGCLQCFQRDGMKFETGMHFIGSLDDGKVLSNYLNYLEIKDKIEVNRLDENAYDIVSLNGEKFAFPNGREAFIEHFSERFPDQRKNLEHYCELVEQVAELSPFRDLKLLDDDSYFQSNELLFKSLNEIIDNTITDPLLRNVLVGNLSLYSAEIDKTPFAVHAFIFDFYNNGAYRIVGGSDTVAKALNDRLLHYGGRVLTRQKVTKIVVENKMAKGVMTANGSFYPADVVISDINPKQVIDIVDDTVFNEAYKTRIRDIGNTNSVFSLYLRFKDEAMPYLNSNFHGFQSVTPWGMSGIVDEKWPTGYLYMHYCHEKSPKYAKSGVILSYMSIDALKRWKDTSIGNRGADYEHFKHEMAERLLDSVEKDFPGLRDTIADYHAATPLTYRDYTSTPDGSIYGLAKDVNKGIAGRVSFRTKVPNLFLVGQNINSHGMLGVLVGTMTVCSQLIGEQVIKKQIIDANKKTVLVIGGGLGGLVTGSILSKEGYKVTVLEKNAIIGGGLQTFKRHGVSFATGMHIFGGFNEGGNLKQIFDYLGITEKLHLLPTDADSCDEVTIADDNATYHLPKGKENLINYLSDIFPEEAENIRNYIEKLFELSQEEDLYYLRESSSEPNFAKLSEDFLKPYNILINKYIQNPKLKRLLVYLSPLFGGVEDMTPAFFNALLSVLHINGTFQFVDGSQQMADLLKEVIENGGGKVLANEEVVKINVDNHLVTDVLTKNGNSYHADHYISDVHPDVLLKVISEDAFSTAFKKRIHSVPESVSSFKVYIKFKKNTFKFINHPCYYIDNQMDWPNQFMSVTPPVTNQGAFADTMIIISPMEFEQVKQWGNTMTGHRGEKYEIWKRQMTEKLLDLVENIYPKIRDAIEFSFASSPLTIRDFYGNKYGSNYGFQKDSNNLMLSQMSVFTKVKNLYLTGQNVNIHGFCGVSITAIETAEAIVGHNEIVRKINKKFKSIKKSVSLYF
ncbi:MAG: NAD(P)/FAD-dependent oxidoreductase [Bacteroidales bacterium]|nr:NAD(P)/FAD-dependent oxidoreductase [Bacteroidales bacterium]